MKKIKELDIPCSTDEHINAFEILRIWKTTESKHFSLLINAQEDPFLWGMTLVDLARHVANSYHQQTGYDRSEMLSRIKAGFDAEWEKPTAEATGKVLE